MINNISSPLQEQQQQRQHQTQQNFLTQLFMVFQVLRTGGAVSVAPENIERQSVIKDTQIYYK